MSGQDLEVHSLDSDSSEELRLMATIDTSCPPRNRPTTAPHSQAQALGSCAVVSSPTRPRTAPANRAKLRRFDGQCTASSAARETARTLVRQQKKAALDAERRARIDRAFAAHQQAGGDRRDEVELLVSPSLYNTKSKVDVLGRARVLFPDQILPVEQGVSDLILWRRRKKGLNAVHYGTNVQTSVESDFDAKACAVVFSATEYMDRIVDRTLNNFSQFILSKRISQKLMFIIYGIQKECRKRTTAASLVAGGAEIYDMRYIQDCFTHMYMTYGIRTHSCESENDVGQYIVDLTEAVANLPYHQKSDFIESALEYRDSKRALSDRTVVVARGLVPPTRITSISNDENDNDNPASGILGEDSVDGNRIIIRSERSTDLGYMYIAILHQIPNMSPSRARAVRQRYPTLHSLLTAYRKCSSAEQQHTLIADIRVGQGNGRSLGPALSKSVAITFTSLNPKTIVQR